MARQGSSGHRGGIHGTRRLGTVKIGISLQWKLELCKIQWVFETKFKNHASSCSKKKKLSLYVIRISGLVETTLDSKIMGPWLPSNCFADFGSILPGYKTSLLIFNGNPFYFNAPQIYIPLGPFVVCISNAKFAIPKKFGWWIKTGCVHNCGLGHLVSYRRQADSSKQRETYRDFNPLECTGFHANICHATCTCRSVVAHVQPRYIWVHAFEKKLW